MQYIYMTWTLWGRSSIAFCVLKADSCEVLTDFLPVDFLLIWLPRGIYQAACDREQAHCACRICATNSLDSHDGAAGVRWKGISRHHRA